MDKANNIDQGGTSNSSGINRTISTTLIATTAPLAPTTLSASLTPNGITHAHDITHANGITSALPERHYALSIYTLKNNQELLGSSSKVLFFNPPVRYSVAGLKIVYFRSA